MEKNNKKEQIKKLYDDMVKKDNYMTQEELQQLIKSAKDILEYIRNPREVESNNTVEIIGNANAIRELDMTIASIVHEIKYV